MRLGRWQTLRGKIVIRLPLTQQRAEREDASIVQE
jgi:hypothetical protein